MCSLGFKIEGNPSCHRCGNIMVRKEELWACTSCGATTGCTEVKDGEK